MRNFGYFNVIQIIEDFKLIFILYNKFGDNCLFKYIKC